MTSTTAAATASGEGALSDAHVEGTSSSRPHDEGTNSGIPPLAGAMTGKPHAIASMGTVGQGSLSLA